MIALPYQFQDNTLLRTALTVPAPNRHEPDYQRLEFLGDAVLQLLVSERLFAAYPEALEGELTERRIHLVSGKSLAQRAPRLNLEALLREVNPGHTWPAKACIDTVEALLGAAWLDGGRPAAEALFQILFAPEDFQGALLSAEDDNPKGALQRFAQHRFKTMPTYALIACEGPNHAPSFRCSATLEGHTAEGTGPTRKAAESDAARTLLSQLLAW